jgi:type VI secretion system protein ImpK
MSQSNGPDDMRDATIVRPRGAAPAATPAAAPTPPASSGPVPQINEFLENGANPLVQAASPLLLLAVQVRHSAAPPDANHLREQVIAQMRRFESLAQGANVPSQSILAARYVLCTMLDEAVLNSPWGEHSGWAQKTLLVTFHSESYGGAKFFQILERLCSDFSKHIDLIELMYICLALGFAGRYHIETGGRAKLADIQQDLYQRIQSQRAKPADELAPHWRGIDDRRNPLIRYVPLWVVAAFAAVVLLGAFVFFYSRLNDLSAPISGQLARVGLENGVPPDTARQPHPARKSLKQLLAPEEQAGLLSVDEQANGQAMVRLAAAEMFPSGGVDVGADQIPLLHKITAALNQVQGRVIVVGHTDDQPIRSLKYKDNFELSAARAKSVAQILSDGLDNAARIESNGAGSSQPIALPPDLPANRTRNRRVEIMFIPED